MEFNFKPKVTGTGSFSPPPGYELINGQWVNTADTFEESITTTCSTKENDMDEQQNTPECSGAEAATECQGACSTTSTTAEVNTEAVESTGCAKAESPSEESAE